MSHPTISFESVECRTPPGQLKVFLKDASQTIKLLVEAIEAEGPKNVKLYAHKLRGSARHVAARKSRELFADTGICNILCNLFEYPSQVAILRLSCQLFITNGTKKSNL